MPEQLTELTSAPPASPPPPPLPPRRDPSLTAAQPSNTTRASSSSSWWSKAKESTVGAWNSAYAKADQVGYWGNKQGAKLGVEAFYPTSLDLEATKCARILRTFTVDAADLPEEVSLVDRRKSQVVLKKIPPAAIAAAQGLAIFTVFRSGFIVSGASGSGVVLSRLKDGTWSAPSGILLHTIGFGFSAGVDVYDVVLILRTDKSVDSFKNPRVSLGGEISIAAGPVGNGFAIETSHTLSPVWSYTKSKGLYGGVNLAGTVLIERNDENARSYGRKVKAAEILDGSVHVPQWCDGLHQTILAAEGLDYQPHLIPQGPSASEVAPSPDPSTFTDASADPGVSSPSTASPPNSPPNTSPTVSFLSSFSRSASQMSGASSRSRASSNATTISTSTAATAVRKLPKEELDDEDLAARRELEAALRSFGIEDPEINLKSRAEDKLLVVEEKGETEAGSATTVEVAAPGAGVLSDAVEHPPRNSTESVQVASAAVVSCSGSISGSPRVGGVGEKPPVPPRRTPRLGTTAGSSAANSPVPSSPAVEQKRAEDAEPAKAEEGEKEEKQDGEEKKAEEAADETEASESFEDADDGAASPAAEEKHESKDGAKGEEAQEGDEGSDPAS